MAYYRKSAAFARGVHFCAAVFLLAAVPVASLQAQPEREQARRGVLEEVIVTARRRAENIQETPIAVTALSADDLRERGVGNIQDLDRIVPSVQIAKARTNAIFIRGVGERTGFARVDPAVGVYLDDLFLPRADGHLLDTVDIQSIQVLRGPQGTLFGKNTTGGAMVLTLTKPHEAFEGYVEAGVGSFNLRRAKVGVNVPVTDRFFVRAAANTIEDDGYIEDVIIDSKTGSNDRLSFLLQSRWDATDRMTLDALAFYGKIREAIPTVHCNIVSEDALFIKGLYLQWPGDTTPGSPTAYRQNCESNSRERMGDFKTRMGPNPFMTRDLETILIGGTYEWRFSDNHTFKTVVGARDARKGDQYLGDNDGGTEEFSEAYSLAYNTPGDSGNRQSFSLEFQLNGSTSSQRLRYTFGLFGMNETNEEPFTLFTALAGLDGDTLSQLAQQQRPTAPPENGTVPFVGILSDPIRYSQFELENTTLAAFTQASFDITPQLELTAGLRFTSEKRSSDLTTIISDREAIAERMQGSGLFGDPVNPGVFGPSAGGLHPFFGPWAADPVRIANDLFPDVNGDSIPDFPLDRDNPLIDHREETFRETTPMVSLSYVFPESSLADAVDSLMIYGTWSTGFKSGFFEPRGVDGLERIEPETVENREIGFKLEALQRSVRLNVALYNMDFENMQLIQVKTDSANNLQVIFQNAGASEIRGGEMELNWLPTPNMTINLSYSNNNYSFTDFSDFDLATLAIEQERVLVDRTSEPFPVSPQDSFSAGVQYAWQTDIGTFMPRVDVRYKSERYFGIDHGAALAFARDVDLSGDGPYTVVDFRFAWQSVKGETTLSAYVENLNDERYVNNSGGVGDSVATNTGQLARPRAYGLNIRQLF